MEDAHKLCARCAHHKTCTELCIFAEIHVNAGKNNPCRESEIPGSGIVIVYPQPRQVKFSAFKDEDGHPGAENILDSELAEVWPGTATKYKMTGIFIDRFFRGWSFADLAIKYDCNVEGAADLYYHGRERLKVALAKLDLAQRPQLKRMQQNTGKLSNQVKYFLMAKVFDLTSREIAEIMGVNNPDVVGVYIKKCSDQLKAGKQLLVFEGDEVRGATRGEVLKQARALQGRG